MHNNYYSQNHRADGGKREQIRKKNIITSNKISLIITFTIILIIQNFRKLEKEYRDCIKSKWRQDWDMNETL